LQICSCSAYAVKIPKALCVSAAWTLQVSSAQADVHQPWNFCHFDMEMPWPSGAHGGILMLLLLLLLLLSFWTVCTD